MLGAIRALRPTPFVGYGAQFDTDLFTPKGEPKGLKPARLAQLKQQLVKLHPGHVRVFVKPEALVPGPEHDALIKTVALAQQAGATVNLTLWHADYFQDNRALMGRFAGLLTDMRRQGVTAARYVTIQNEPNTHDLSHEVRAWKHAHPGQPVPATVKARALHDTLALYERLYRDLDEALAWTPDPLNQMGDMRTTVHLVGGDLCRGPRADGSLSQDDWLRYMASHMSDVLDGYSLHVYWTVGRAGEDAAEARLAHAGAIVAASPAPKPLYVTEYGAKAAPNAQPGTLRGQPLETTVEAAFDHAWFNALAPQYGVVGLVKWAAYATDGHTFGDWGEIRANGETTPLYKLGYMFDHAVGRGWSAVGGARRAGDQLVSAFVGPRGESSVVALNRGPASAVTRIDGLVPGRRYQVLVWNGDGKGELHHKRPATAAADGTLRIAVPAHGVVSLVGV